MLVEPKQNHMSRIYKYPSYVKDVSTVDSSNLIPRRSKLTIELNRTSGDQALFVMMNPSKATKDFSDKTVNGIIKYTYERNAVLNSISRIVVLNLYTVYETASGQLAQLVAQYGYEFTTGNDDQISTSNDKLIALEADRSMFVVAAWGKPSADAKALRDCFYFQRISEVLEILKNHKIFHLDNCLRENLYPKHPRGIDYSWVLSNLNVAELLDKLRQVANF